MVQLGCWGKAKVLVLVAASSVASSVAAFEVAASSVASSVAAFEVVSVAAFEVVSVAIDKAGLGSLVVKPLSLAVECRVVHQHA